MSNDIQDCWHLDSDVLYSLSMNSQVGFGYEDSNISKITI